MYYIGIDISKFKHDCFITDETGQTIHDSFSFKNSSEGFNEFLSILESLDSTKEIRIGFESTSHYSYNLKFFLTKHQFTFMELHPLKVKEFISTATLRKTKTDKKDCKHIANYLKTIDYEPIPNTFYHKDSLKSLCRLREFYVKERSKYLVLITNVLDRIFPEFKPFIKDLKSATAMYILKTYTTPENISLNLDCDKLRCISRGKFTPLKCEQLKYLASNTIGFTYSTAEIELSSLINQYDHVSFEIENIEMKIEAEVIYYNPEFLKIRGMGIITAGIIIGEYGDFKRFKSADAMVAFAGLDARINQSGTHESYGKMLKRGSSHLRYALLNVCVALIKFNSVFASIYFKKINEGKHHRVALTHVAKKLIRIIYHLETSNDKYDEFKLV